MSLPSRATASVAPGIFGFALRNPVIISSKDANRSSAWPVTGTSTIGAAGAQSSPKKARRSGVRGAAPRNEAPPPMRRLVEALLFVAGAPLTAARAAEALRGVTAEQLAEVVEELNLDYRRQGRPYRVQPRDGGYEMALLPRYRSAADRL